MLNRNKMMLVFAVAIAVAGAISFAYFGFIKCNNSTRQTMIHEKGFMVMPFDLNSTKHVFTSTENGGIQQVIVIDPKNNEQIGLIRRHLKEEAHKFSKGDFSDPAMLHGHVMSGLEKLQKGFADINVLYSELPNGAQITYKSNNHELVKAIHAWFDAQRSDHGNDVMQM